MYVYSQYDKIINSKFLEIVCFCVCMCMSAKLLDLLQTDTILMLTYVNVILQFILFNYEILILLIYFLVKKQYFCPGMKIKEKYLSEFCIAKITAKDHDIIKDMSSLNISDFENESFSACGTSFNLNESRPSKLLPYGLNESVGNKKTEEQSVELDSLFSSMSLKNKEYSSLNSPDKSFNTEFEFSDFKIPEFYSIDFATCISIDSDRKDAMTSTRSFSQIGGLKEELMHLQLLINEFLNHERNQKSKFKTLVKICFTFLNFFLYKLPSLYLPFLKSSSHVLIQSHSFQYIF